MNRIAELRKLNKISQADFGKAMGVAQNTVSQWERGAREPDLTMLNNIAAYFGVSIDYLMGNESGISFALYGGDKSSIDSKVMKDVQDFAAYIKLQKNKASSKDEAEVEELMKLYAKLTPENRTILLAAAKGLAQDK